MLKTRPEVATINAEDDPQFFSGSFLENVREGTGQSVKIIQFIPFDETVNVGMKSTAKEWHEAKIFRGLGRMQLMERLEPKKCKFDGMFSLMGVGNEMTRLFRSGGEIFHQFFRTGYTAERRNVIALVEIPLER